MNTRSMSSIPCSRASSISRRERRPELRLQLAAEAAERRGGQHRLPRAADPDREVVVRAADRRGDRGGDVAVLDQLDPRAGGADLLDQVVVARPVEDDRRDVVRPAAEGLGDRPDVLADRRGRSIRPRARGPTAILRMYMSGRSAASRAVTDDDHRHRVRCRRARRRRGPRAGRARGRPRSPPAPTVPLGELLRSVGGADHDRARRSAAVERGRLPENAASSAPPGRRGRASARRRAPRARSTRA